MIVLHFFTGANRHVPGSQSSMGPSTGTDPFTGAGRYIPGGQTAQPQGSGVDPFTGRDCQPKNLCKKKFVHF